MTLKYYLALLIESGLVTNADRGGLLENALAYSSRWMSISPLTLAIASFHSY